MSKPNSLKLKSAYYDNYDNILSTIIIYYYLLIFTTGLPAFVSRRLLCILILKIIKYHILGLPAYLFFWLRQNLLYKQPSLKKLNSAVVRIFSLLSLVFLVSSVLGLAFAINRFQSFTMTSQVGCATRKLQQGVAFSDGWRNSHYASESVVVYYNN